MTGLMFPILVAEGEAVSSGTVSGVLSDVTTAFSSAVNMVTGNPIGAIFVGFAVVAGGIKLFRKIRK